MKNAPLFSCLAAALCLLLFSGCALSRKQLDQQAVTVKLSQNNYRLVKPAASGRAYGFNLLGVVPLVSPSYAKARKVLFQSVDEDLRGKSVVLMNQVEERSALYFVLFSVPSVSVSADVIEFTGGPGGK